MKRNQQDFRTEKYLRYGIRKYSFGAASVAIAAGLMFLGNGAVSATEVQGTEASVAATTAPDNQADSKDKPVKAESDKVESKVEEAKKVNKAVLEASIATLESKLSTAKYAEVFVLSSAKEALATAKATLANVDANQAEVDHQAATVSALSLVVTESNTAGFDKKQAADKEAAKEEAEKTATPAEKALSVATTTLTQVSSEAEVTNKLAETQLAKADVKEENKAAVTAAVAKNQTVLAETKKLLADKSVTKEQVDAQLERLNESILAVYNELKNAGIGRDGKLAVNLAETETTALIDGSNELGKKWLEDHGYASLADVPVKKNSKEIATLNDQIQWLDFSDTNDWTNLVDGKILQVGSQYRKEIMPGYVVTLTVKELKPFESTLAYKNRVAGTEHEASYDADKDNKFNAAVGFSGYPQDGRYTNVRERGAGINTGNHKTALGAVTASGGRVNGVNAGVLFTVDATYNNKPVKPGIVMTSGEDISDANYEAEIYTTNGTPWDLAGTVGSGNKTQYKPLPDFNRVNGTLTFNTEEFKKALAAKMFATRDSATAGLGSQIFGSYSNGGGKYSTPIVSTANASEVGIYIISTGLQSTMIGVKISDFGDLPESYGTAEHFLRTEATDWNTGVKRQIQQPFLGTEKADVDSVSGIRVRGEGSDDRKDSADEGVKQLLAPEHVHENVDTGEPEVKLVKAQDNTYEVNVVASANGNTNYTGTLDPAYVRGFIDFNNNGKFDADEASEIVRVTENNQKVTLRFTHKQIVDTTKETVNFRVRIAKEESQVEKPAGIAYSGEVEDNQIQVAIPPRGDKEETTGVQGEKQTIDFEFVNRPEGDDATNVGSGNQKVTFNSYGKVYYSEQRNKISLETTKVKQADGVMIVKPDGSLGKTYTKDGQGTYEVTDTGVTFTPVANFVGKADGIVLRAVDANGQSTGWTAAADTGLENNNTGIHTTTDKTMDAVYIPTVTKKEITGEPKTSIDVQGKEQKETVVFKTDAGKATEAVIRPTATSPAKLIDPTTKAPIDAPSVTVENEGTYTIVPETGEVKFQPLPTFKGKAKGIGVSLTVPVGADKAGTEVTATATTTYTPEVVPVAPTAEPATSTDIQGAEQSSVVAFAPGKATIGDAEKTVELKPNSAKLLNADGSVPTEATVPAFAEDGVTRVGTYSIDPATNRVTFTPTDKAYVGKVLPANVQAEDVNGTTVKTTYTPTIVGVKPTATPGESTNIQGEVQSGTVAFAPGKATIGDVEKTVAIKPNSAKLLNADGSVPTEATVPAYKEDGVTQVGTYSIDPATNTVTFTPTDKTYTGKVLPANVQAEDENGSTVKTTYTPHIVGVTPTADPATSTDIQGVEQSKEVTFTPGKTEINGTEKTVAIDTTSFKLLDENESAVDSVPAKNPAGDVIGTYTLKVVDGKVNAVFTPTDKTYAGEVEPVTIQAKDTNGTVVKTTYTPSITPVEPSGTPTTSEGIQGAKQEGTPSFTPGDERIPMKIDADQPAKLVNPETGKPTDDTTIPAKDNDGNTVGTYTIEPTTGKVTFTPNKDFTGTPVAATVQAKDANGTPTTATYEPTVKPVTPTGSDTVTEDVQGSIQKGKPTFEGGKVTVNGEEKTVAIDEDKPAKLVDPKTGDPVESVTIDGEGTYTVTPDGTVTFTPEKNFTGKGTGVTVQREDKNATPVTAKYTPVVKPATPTSSDVITTNVQGAIQEGTPTFTGGKVTINGQEKTVAIDEAVKPKFDDGTTEKVVPNEGTYTIDENGKVTFTPEKTFTGQAAGVTVKRVDKNGTPVTAKYTPVVIPVSPTSKDAESEGPKGQSQEGTPTFTGGKVTLNGKEVPVAIDENVKPKFDDGTTEKVVPNEGTYTIDENGKVTFTPEPNFVGKATGVTVKRVDKNGTPVTAKYTPTVRPDTRFVVIEKDGKETDLLPSKDGAKPSEPIPGYNVVRTEIDEKGNTKHIYEKVKTSFKDKEGNEIPKYPSEPGTVDKKDIPEYRFVETKKLPNGDTEHIYEKVKTSFKDKEGNEIPKYPSEPGTVDKKDIPEYRFVETKKLPNGDTEHIYEKVKTSFKDKEGNEIPKYPSEPGTVDKKDIPEYRFVETKKLPNGDTEHIYEKVKTSFKDKEGNEIPKYPSEPGTVDKKDIPEYRFVETKKLPNGDTEHIYEKVKTSFKDKEGNEIPKYPSEPGTVDKKDIPEYRFVETKKLPNGDTEHIYEKVKTSFKDKEGNEIPKYPSEPGTVDKKDIPEYRFVETKKLPNGDTEHIYEKVKTSFKDKEGNEIPKYPSEPGTVDKKDIPEYRFVETKKLPNGDTEHVYEKVKTSHKDKEGNVIPNYPTEDGEQPKKDIPGYRFVETKKLPNGDTEHVYEKVKTSHKDKEGNEIPNYPTEDGEQPKKDIPGYRFVETKKLPNGDTEHIYEKVKTSFKDKEGNEIPKYPSEPGTVDKKDIPEYRFVETKKLPNGDTEHIYEKVKTSFKDKEGNEIPKYPSEPGTVDKKDIPEYRFVETKKLPNGDTEHVYEKVKTSHKDKEGNVIPNYPTEDGEQPKKDIPGYRFVETKKLPNGDTEHVYEKVKTSHKDKEGNVIPNYPTEDGEQPKKDIPGYRFVETKKLPNGDTEHIYEKVKTSFKDKEGNEIPKYPSEPGTVDKKDIPEYRFVETKKLPNGDTEHIYEKVKTSHKDKEGNEIPKYPSEPGTVDKKDIPEYRFVETKKLPNGDTEHVYEKVKTSHKDKEGNVIPNYPTEDGEQPKKDIPGYRFVETKKLPNGDTEHVYEKVKTSHKDKEGNVIPNYPTEDGEQPKKNIPGYEFVKTTTDKDGNVTHVYRKVVKTTTSFVDESGKPVSPNEEGSQPKKNIPGYEFVKTTTDKDGNVTHVYRKVVKTTTSFVDESGKPVSPNEEGNQPKKNIPGYEFVKTTTDKDGNVTHVYRKVVPAAPKQEQSKPAKELPNTGTEDHSSLAALGLLGVLSGFGLVARKKKED